jgi:zinc/manganese transport system permease protein
LTSLAAIFEPGFFSNPAVHTALIVGGVVAVVSAVVGTFTVMRGQSFAGHSLADIGAAGGSGAALVGISSLYGFLAVNLAAAAIMDLIGVRSARGRDLATGIVLGAALGLAALFLYEDTVTTSTNSTTVSVLFGSIFTVSGSTTPVVTGFSVLAVGLMAILYRPLLLSSVSTDLAAARGVPVRLIAIGYLLALAIAVSLSALTIGAILSTALLVGPAATALRLVNRTGHAIALAAAIGVAAVWLGVLLAYDSVSWTSGGQGWPVSFFIVAMVFAFYLLAQLTAHFRPDRRTELAPGGVG